MARHSIIATLGLQARLSICLAGCALAALTAAAPAAQAAQQSVVLPDPDTVPEQDELGRALGLLVRSAFSGGEARIIPRRELALALEALGAKSHGKGLVVPSDLEAKLLARIGANAIVTWRLEDAAKGMMVTGTMVGAGGKRLLRIRAVAAAGDVAVLARSLASRIAGALSVSASGIADVGLAELRPFLAADAALLANDSVAASRAIEIAWPAVAATVPEARNTLQTLAEDPGLSALPRAQARLLRAEWPAAVALADAGLGSEPKNALLRSIKIRALVGSRSFGAAEAELVLLRGSRNGPALAAATLALVLETGGSREDRDAALAPLLGRPPAEWRAVLPMIAATPPGTFGAKTEAAALAAAEKLMVQEPGVASLVAARALATGGMLRQAAALVTVPELSATQISAVAARLAAEADAGSVDLSKQISKRQEQAKVLAEESGPEHPTGPPSMLAGHLKVILQGLDELYDPALASIQIAALPGSGQPFYWPFLLRPQRMREGLLEALMRAPWALKATLSKVETELLPPERLSDEGIATLANDLGASALLLYRVRPASLAPWATLELILYDAVHQRSQRIEAALVGRSTGIMIVNPLVVGVAAVLVLALLAWLVVISLRGTIMVRVQWDADAKDELFSLLISRSPTTPSIQNIAAYRKKLEWLGERKRRYEAWNIQQNTTFRGIPRGKWYVHLYGIYTRGRQTMLLHEPPQEVVLAPRKTVFVAHVLESAEAEFKILVVDDAGPVEGARVWLDDERAKAVTTAKAGLVSLKVAKGYHVIRVSAREMTVERPYHVVKAKVHDMTINLVWERRQEYVSRALERQVDDAEEYLRKPAQTSGPGATAATVFKPLVTPPAASRASTAAKPAQPIQAEVPASSVADPALDVLAAGAPVDLVSADAPVDLPPIAAAADGLRIALDDRPLDAASGLGEIVALRPEGSGVSAAVTPAGQPGRASLCLKPLRPESASSANPPPLPPRVPKQSR